MQERPSPGLVLNFTTDSDNSFRFTSHPTPWRATFGGQFLGQSVVASYATVDKERHLHSVYGNFMRVGNDRADVRYRVDSLRDGGSYSLRSISALQGKANPERQVFTAIASFSRAEHGLSHRRPMPLVPPPEDLPTLSEHVATLGSNCRPEVAAQVTRPRMIELRLTDLDRWKIVREQHAVSYTWMRADQMRVGDHISQQAMLAYASDISFLDAPLLVHGKGLVDADVRATSLNHSIYFYDQFDFRDWMLFEQYSPASGGGRGMAFGHFYTRDGKMVMSVVQEGLMRTGNVEKQR